MLDASLFTIINNIVCSGNNHCNTKYYYFVFLSGFSSTTIIYNTVSMNVSKLPK